MNPITLKTDSLINPLGIGEILPVLSWQLSDPDSSSPLKPATAWQILVADSLENLGADVGNLWDSGKIVEPRAHQAVYRGLPLSSRQRAWWKVRVWIDGNATEWSEPAYWEMGLLERSEWRGEWIGSPISGSPSVCAPTPYVRRSFSLDKPVASARLYATALGLYECELNGKRVGDSVFTPGWTEYKKRVNYQSYDVTSFLTGGKNVLGAILGDGWFCGAVGWKGRQFYGERPQFLAQLEVTFADGSRVVIATDSEWQTSIGPILQSDMQQGESYDARQELGAWSVPGYGASAWQPVAIYNDPGIEIQAPAFLPVRRLGHLSSTLLKSPESNKRIYDLGQNFSGRVRISVKGSRGVDVTLRHGEILNAQGLLYTDNLRSALATDHYTLKGEGVETYEPRFTFHGFRYVEVAWRNGDLQIENLEGIVLHSEIPPTGNFSCSNPLINQLQHNIQWGQKGNFLEVPTDCPQRDERLGWAGDALVFVRTACFNADVRPFFTKWMLDIRDAQHESGAVPCVIPDMGVTPGDGGPAWSDATIVCPWTVYLCYGDMRILEHHYVSMERYVNFLAESSKGLIRCHPDVTEWGGFGDWLALDGSKGCEGFTPKDLIGTAFFANDAELMARISRVLGKPEKEAHYRKLHTDIIAAFRNRFVTPEGLMAGATQTSYVLALYFNLLPKESRATAAKELARSIEKNGTHLSTGFVGTPFLCQVLEDHGYLDLAYRLLEQETFPSWLFPVKNGATTIWERWDGWTPEKGFQDVGMNSFNHYAYGAIGAWMVSTVAGLDLDPEEPGYRHINFRPRPGGTISWAKASLETPFGLASIHWELKEGLLHINLLVPANARATISLPPSYSTEAGLEIEAGSHQIIARQ